ncbi:flavin reductase family protein [Pseudohoeflea suaedae]|uniref:Flavin reductase family protein n=1 Tax=Pseudohoeflea suaedae TaxID=877384 RepID=A0A4R5PQD8_9HYPH|nr:flavin reductase family protein [Pseudohoeflea suaedae]TDH39259.1 flavin reductase family protein [Pseudohoeflea suaedae]
MFYKAGEPHGLPHDPFKALVAPRPIGWIGTRGSDGSVNLAPYSYFNAVSAKPPMVMFSSFGRKDTLRNCEETGVFTASLVSRDLTEAMNRTAVDAPYGESEFVYAGLEMAEAELVDAPYVAKAWAALECRVTEIMRPRGLDGEAASNWLVFGQVLGVRIRDDVLKDGMVDMSVANPVGRLGYMDYTDSADLFQMFRPRWADAEKS